MAFDVKDNFSDREFVECPFVRIVSGFPLSVVFLRRVLVAVIPFVSKWRTGKPRLQTDARLANSVIFPESNAPLQFTDIG